VSLWVKKDEYPISRPARRDPADAGNIQLMKGKAEYKKAEYILARRHGDTKRITAIVFSGKNNGKFYFSLCLCATPPTGKSLCENMFRVAFFLPWILDIPCWILDIQII